LLTGVAFATWRADTIAILRRCELSGEVTAAVRWPGSDETHRASIAPIAVMGGLDAHNPAPGTGTVSVGYLAACVLLVAAHDRPFTGHISVAAGPLLQVMPEAAATVDASGEMPE
jgi:hypothetical protein